jgi:hypothetical protein
MDQETVHRIAEEVARLSGYPWSFLAVQVIVTLLAAGFGTFLVEYLKTRGKNLATTADFERLQKELSANTKLVETIKADVGQRDWAAREWTNLRRVKLEELLNKVAVCEAFCERQYHHILDTGSIPTERDFGSELDMITTLYFPELRSEVSAYLVQFHQFRSANAKLGGQLASAESDQTARWAAMEAYSADHKTRYPLILKARKELNDAARKLILKIMG